MIRDRVVLVFGAGASQPFGFPSGFQLFAAVASATPTAGSQDTVNSLAKLGYDRRELLEFVHCLRKSGKTSVDAFLEHRSDFLTVGKAAIAIRLMPLEQTDLLFIRPRGPHLYDHIFAKLNCQPGEFYRNNLVIITYNYDRSFEHFLTTALQNSYGLPEPEAATVAKSVPVIHLHGQLGNYRPFTGDGRSYDAAITRDAVGTAAEGIRVIHEATPNDEPFQAAWTALNQANRIYVLGFAYDPVNVGRLFRGMTTASMPVFGSALGLKDAERHAIQQMISANVILDTQGRDLLEFLRDTPALDQTVAP